MTLYKLQVSRRYIAGYSFEKDKWIIGRKPIPLYGNGTTTHTKPDKRIVCDFAFDVFGLYTQIIPLQIAPNGTANLPIPKQAEDIMQCSPPNSDICNGISTCDTDECGCPNRTGKI